LRTDAAARDPGASYSEREVTREGIKLDVSTLADWVGASAAMPMPLAAYNLIRLPKILGPPA